ncbi:MAG: hypothetical protein WA892_12480 [Ornithinimicrobium sp.]
MTHARSPHPPLTRRSALGWLAAGTFGVAAAAVTGCSRRPDVMVTGQVDAVIATAYRDLAHAGMTQVNGLWGPGSVPLPVRLHLPRSATQWAQSTGQLGQFGPSGQFAASTVRRPGQEPVVVIHPDTWDALRPEGRASVVTHELTHLAMGPSGSAPWWLTEGLAEYTAHSAFDGAPSEIAGSALTGLLARPPQGWPQPAAASDPWQGYAAAWLACVFLADEVGDQAMLGLYAATRAGRPFDQVCPAVFDRSASRLHRQWLDWLGSLGRPSPAASAQLLADPE